MKKCRKCGELLSKSKFSKDPRNKDGLKNKCKKCDSVYWKEYTGQFKSEAEVNKIIGGYKCYILKYAKKGEFKYNIVSTNGEVINTNNKNEIVDYIIKNC